MPLWMLIWILGLVTILVGAITTLISSISQHRRAQAMSVLKHSGLIERVEDDEA